MDKSQLQEPPQPFRSPAIVKGPPPGPPPAPGGDSILTSDGLIDGAAAGIRPGQDNGPLLSSLVAASGGRGIQLPAGPLPSSVALSYDQLPACILKGAGMDQGGTQLLFNVPGPAIHRISTGTGNVHLSNLRVQNAHPQGECLHFESVYGCTLEKVVTRGARHIQIGGTQPGYTTNTEIALRDIVLDGDLAQFPGGVGLLTRGQVNVAENIFARQLSVAMQFSGKLNLFGARLEENVTGIILGVQPDGTGFPLSGLLSGVTIESVLTCLRIEKSAGFITFINFGVADHDTTLPGQPSQPNISGFDIAGQALTFIGCTVGGNFTAAPIVYRSPAGADNAFRQCRIVNKLDGKPNIVVADGGGTDFAVNQCQGF